MCNATLFLDNKLFFSDQPAYVFFFVFFVCVWADSADESEQIRAPASPKGHAYWGPDAASEDLQGKRQSMMVHTITDQKSVALKHNRATSAPINPLCMYEL